jgi:hypothetical protein
MDCLAGHLPQSLEEERGTCLEQLAGTTRQSAPRQTRRARAASQAGALAANQHWAMDRHLIAPVPDNQNCAGVWQMNESRLDDRIKGQRELIAIGGRGVIPPGEEKYHAALESLQWREDHLVTSY